MTHRNECKRIALESQTGQTGHLNDLELIWLKANGATSDNLQDAWKEVLIQNGIVDKHINDMWHEWLGNLGATQESLADRWQYFWCDLGGAGFGPVVVINKIAGGTEGVCEYPEGGNCTATAVYQATAINFGGAISFWTWNIDNPAATIISGAGTDTVTVETANSNTNVSFELSCQASDVTDTETGVRNYTHTHKEEALKFIGPDIANQTFIIDQPYTLDVSALFSPAPDGYALQGSWPAGFSISGAGVITGTATAEASYTGLSVRATKSGDPDAVSNTFNGDATAETGLTYFHSANYSAADVTTGVGELLSVTRPAAVQAGDARGIADTMILASNAISRAPDTADLMVMEAGESFQRNSRILMKGRVLTGGRGLHLGFHIAPQADLTGMEHGFRNNTTAEYWDATLAASVTFAEVGAYPMEYAMQLGGFDANGVPDNSGKHGVKVFNKVGADWKLQYVDPVGATDTLYYVVRGITGGPESYDDTMLLDAGNSDIHTPVHLSKFTAPDGTALEAYTPDIGPVLSSFGGSLEINSNRISPAVNSVASYGIGDMAEADVFLSVTDQWTSLVSGVSALITRFVDTDNYMSCRLWDSGDFAIVDKIGGSYTTRGSTTASQTLTDPNKMACRDSGNDFAVWYGGANQLSYSSAQHKGSTQHGVRLTGTNTTHDNFAVWPLTGYDQLDDYAGAGLDLIHKSTFTAADGTDLTAYTPDIGNTWTLPSGAHEVQAEKLQRNGVTGVGVVDVGVAAYDMVADITCYVVDGGNHSNVFLPFGYVDESNYNLAGLGVSGGPLKFILWEISANTWTNRAQGANNYTWDAEHNIFVERDGAEATATVNRDASDSLTYAAFGGAASTLVGIRFAMTGSASESTADNFRVWSLA